MSDLNPEAPTNLDAMITYTVELTASFAETPVMNGQLVSGLECSGADCSGVAEDLGTTFPCSIERTFSASFQEE